MLDTTQRRLAREALDLPHDATVLLSFSRDWRIKGGDTFLRAVKKIDADLEGRLIAVAHHGGDVAVREAKELGVAQMVRDIGHVEDVQQLFAAADVFLAPSRGEGMPYSVLESICTGTPVVASDLPGHDHADEIGACYVVPRDPDAVARKTLDILRMVVNAVPRVPRRPGVDRGQPRAEGRFGAIDGGLPASVRAVKADSPSRNAAYALAIELLSALFSCV